MCCSACLRSVWASWSWDFLISKAFKCMSEVCSEWIWLDNRVKNESQRLLNTFTNYDHKSSCVWGKPTVVKLFHSVDCDVNGILAIKPTFWLTNKEAFVNKTKSVRLFPKRWVLQTEGKYFSIASLFFLMPPVLFRNTQQPSSHTQKYLLVSVLVSVRAITWELLFRGLDSRLVSEQNLCVWCSALK